jgi:DNA-binding CsgD family transcriptional regulator
MSRPPKFKLTERERQVLFYTAKGLRSFEIAQHLGVDAKTVETQIHRIYKFLNIGSRAEAGVAAVHLGLLGFTPREQRLINALEDIAQPISSLPRNEVARQVLLAVKDPELW